MEKARGRKDTERGVRERRKRESGDRNKGRNTERKRERENCPGE